jgi:hypothetical protein
MTDYARVSSMSSNIVAQRSQYYRRKTQEGSVTSARLHYRAAMLAYKTLVDVCSQSIYQNGSKQTWSNSSLLGNI